MLVVYDREAFKGKFDSSLRITFDKNVRGTPFPSLRDLFDDANLKTARPGSFILALPEEVAGAAAFEFMRQPVSGWAISLEFAVRESLDLILSQGRDAAVAPLGDGCLVTPRTEHRSLVPP